LTNLEHLQTQWDENSRLQKKNEKSMKMKTIKIIDKAKMLRVCNDLSWLFIDDKKLDMHFMNDDIQTSCMNWIIDWMLSTFFLINVYQELVQNCFKLQTIMQILLSSELIDKSTLIMSFFLEMTLIMKRVSVSSFLVFLL